MRIASYSRRMSYMFVCIIVLDPSFMFLGVLPNWQAYPDVQIEGGTGVEDPSSPGDLRNDMTFEQCQTECDG